MREVTLKIPDKKFHFFIELMNHLGIEVSQEYDIPDWQKEQLDKALEEHTSGTANYVDWSQIKKELLDRYKNT